MSENRRGVDSHCSTVALMLQCCACRLSSVRKVLWRNGAS